MNKEKLYIFDTTLRDGAQTQGVDFSIDDKIKIVQNFGKNSSNYRHCKYSDLFYSCYN